MSRTAKLAIAVAPEELRRRGKQSRRLRFIMHEVGIRPESLASALRVSSARILAWSEGISTIPEATFEVLDTAFRRYQEPFGGGRELSFDELLLRYAKAAGLPGA